MQPLKFMEYLPEDVQQAAMFCNDGVVIANLPHPARYALHKLTVFGERPASRAVKANKELRQGAALLSYFRESSDLDLDLDSDSDSDLQEAWADLIRRRPDWVSRLRRGCDALVKLAPNLDVATWLKLPGESKSAARKK